MNVCTRIAKNSDLSRLIYTVCRGKRMTTPGETHRRFQISNDKPESLRYTSPSNKAKLNSWEKVQVKLLGTIVKHFAEQVKAARARFFVVLLGKQVPMYEAQKRGFEES